MEHRTVYQPAIEGQNDRKVLLAFNQPLTAKQVAGKTGIPEDTCSCLIAKFAKNGLTTCINPAAGNSRLYWLTKLGRKCQKELCRELNQPYTEYDLPNIEWELYGWICFNHRSAIIKTLIEPMQPSKIKQILRIQKPNIKISANNIRDVIRLLLAKKIVQPVKIKKKAHPRYELTDLGRTLRQLLINSKAHVGQNSSNHI
jgi:DNA-binding HxlR family transcriptional regulator